MSESYIPQLKLGTVGWLSGFEQNGFFPEDLPEDWRLTYLSNELDCVVITQSELSRLGEEDVEDWVEETHEQFCFYLQEPNPITEPLGDKFGGILQLQPQLREEVVAEEVSRFEVGEGVALIQPKGELSPMVLRTVLEQIQAQRVDTLLFVPGEGLIANLANAETISSLLG